MRPVRNVTAAILAARCQSLLRRAATLAPPAVTALRRVAQGEADAVVAAATRLLYLLAAAGYLRSIMPTEFGGVLMDPYAEPIRGSRAIVGNE